MALEVETIALDSIYRKVPLGGLSNAAGLVSRAEADQPSESIGGNIVGMRPRQVQVTLARERGNCIIAISSLVHLFTFALV